MTEFKSAEKFAAEAEAQGFKVTKIIDSQIAQVTVEREGVDATIVWGVKNVYGNCRLGFPTGYRAGVRFDYATTKAHGHYQAPRSIVEVKRIVGMNS